MLAIVSLSSGELLVIYVTVGFFRLVSESSLVISTVFTVAVTFALTFTVTFRPPSIPTTLVVLIF